VTQAGRYNGPDAGVTSLIFMMITQARMASSTQPITMAMITGHQTFVCIICDFVFFIDFVVHNLASITEIDYRAPKRVWRQLLCSEGVRMSGGKTRDVRR
jgi:hypothetical protein